MKRREKRGGGRRKGVGGRGKRGERKESKVKLQIIQRLSKLTASRRSCLFEHYSVLLIAVLVTGRPLSLHRYQCFPE